MCMNVVGVDLNLCEMGVRTYMRRKVIFLFLSRSPFPFALLPSNLLFLLSLR